MVSPPDGQFFGLVHVLAAAVVALARVAFRVLVGQHGALGLHHPRAGVVFRGDELDMLFLATLFLTDSGKDLVVKSLDGHAVVEHAIPLAAWGGRYHSDPWWKAAHFTQKPTDKEARLRE
jgi:hypothetical protein